MIVYILTMDPLDELLSGVRVHGAMVGQSRLSPPWAIEIDSGDPFRLVAMIRGCGWLQRAGTEPVLLAEGTIAVSASADAVVIADHPTTAPRIVISGVDSCFDASTGHDVSELDRTGPRCWGSDDAPDRVLITSYAARGARFATLAAGLPDLITRVGSPATTAALDAAAAETTGTGPGRQVMFDRLVELLLIGTLREWEPTPGTLPSWHRAMSDPLVAPALQAMHDAPAERWTVARLASTTAQSRAAFARRFRETVGEPPIAYLTRWRLAWAADLLAEGMSVEGAARTVGYGDPFAFSTAFRRQHGTTPTGYRRAHHTDVHNGTGTLR